MSITNGYCSLAEAKTEINIPSEDTADDAAIEKIVEDASRIIDDYTSRRFYVETETRYYTAEDTDLLFIDECTAAGTLQTDDDDDRTYETTWASTDYDLEPYNTAVKTRIRITPNGAYSFPTGRKAVKVVGEFGYAATAPNPIRRACIRLASRIWSLKTAPLGVAQAGVSGFDGQIGGTRLVRTDIDLVQWLAPYVRWL